MDGILAKPPSYALAAIFVIFTQMSGVSAIAGLDHFFQQIRY